MNGLLLELIAIISCGCETTVCELSLSVVKHGGCAKTTSHQSAAANTAALQEQQQKCFQGNN